MNDLFQNTSDEQPFTVTELNNIIKDILESRFCDIYLVGEISGYKRAFPSKHSYFVLKDESSQISCNFWNFRHSSLKFDLKDGKKVLIRGKLTLYHPRGTYAVDVHSITEAGIGDLQAAFERLKEKLKSEGLFDERHKKTLPEFPERIAVITSATGAVIEDIKKVSAKRYPLVKLYLYPVLVQGAGSAQMICKAIDAANKSENNYDLIVIARGGGSLEDLWSFNEECMARAVFNSDLPIVSAVGHQVDYTICDFVADIRAATPSAAMEIILPDMKEIMDKLNYYESDLKYTMEKKINNLKDNISNISKNYIFNRPKDIINEIKIELDDKSEDLINYITDKIDFLYKDLDYKERIFSGLNPDNTLKRGFSIIKKAGKTIPKASNLKQGDDIEIIFTDGEKGAMIK